LSLRGLRRRLAPCGLRLLLLGRVPRCALRLLRGLLGLLGLLLRIARRPLLLLL
jgi:hypothetical protein